jgi:hypothetical protein
VPVGDAVDFREERVQEYNDSSIVAQRGDERERNWRERRRRR